MLQIEATAYVKFRVLCPDGNSPPGHVSKELHWRCPESKLDAFLKVLRINGVTSFSVAIDDAFTKNFPVGAGAQAVDD